MKVKSISLYELRIPFLFAITHTLKSRERSFSIVVEIVTEVGTYHYGEGAPREYVVDEPKATILKAFREISPTIDYNTTESIESIKAISDTLSDTYGVPSLSSAMEIALLDVYSLANNITIDRLLNPDDIKHELSAYSGILSTSDSNKFSEILQLVKKLELPHVKIKAGHQDDVNNVKMARELLGENVDIRIDANRAWDTETAKKKIPQFYTYNISGIEEPLITSEIKNLPLLAKEINVPVILDESLYTLEHAQFYSDNIASEKIIYNLKMSKLGGPLRASEVFRHAHKHNISCALGCNVGESAILSATGRWFAQAHPVKFLEGSYSKFFMEDDISTTPLGFYIGGKTDRLTATGTGIKLSKNKMQAFITKIDAIVK